MKMSLSEQRLAKPAMQERVDGILKTLEEKVRLTRTGSHQPSKHGGGDFFSLLMGASSAFNIAATYTPGQKRPGDTLLVPSIISIVLGR